MKFNIKKALFKMGKSAVKHGPEILIAVGISGFVAAVGLTAKAAPKAQQEIEEKKKELGKEKLTVTETVKATWKTYLPVALLTISSAGCIIQSQNVAQKRTAALATLYQLAENRLADQEARIERLFGEEQAEALRKEEMKDQIKEAKANDRIVFVPKGEQTVWNKYDRELVKGSKEDILERLNEFNNDLFNGYGTGLSLNDFNTIIGSPQQEYGDEVGWNPNQGPVRLRWVPVIGDDDTPMLGFEFEVNPYHDYL